MGLIETILGAGLVVGSFIGFSALYKTIKFGSNASQFQAEADALNEEIRDLLSSPLACLKSFAGLLAEDGATYSIFELKNGSGTVGTTVYQAGQIYGNGSVVLKSMQLAQFVPGKSDRKATMTLTATYDAKRKSSRNPRIVHVIAINIDKDAAGTINSCIAQAKMSDGIWQRNQDNIDNIFFVGKRDGGNVGIRTDKPTSSLHVMGSIGLGDFHEGSGPGGWLGCPAGRSIRAGGQR